MIAITANGNIDFDVTANRRYVIALSGDFDSGTVALEYKLGSSYVAIRDAVGPVTFTAGGAIEVTLPSKTIRFVTSGVAAASAINVSIGRVVA